MIRTDVLSFYKKKMSALCATYCINIYFLFICTQGNWRYKLVAIGIFYVPIRHKEGQMKHFFVGGPNQRKDFHIDCGEEV